MRYGGYRIRRNFIFVDSSWQLRALLASCLLVLLGVYPVALYADRVSVTANTANAIVKQVAASAQHTCALFTNGAVKCWGLNDAGQLGQGNTTTVGDQPGRMGDVLRPIELGEGVVATQIDTGANFACARLSDGGVKCWGNNDFGQLGQGHTNALGDDANEMGDNLLPINLGTGRSAVQISTGDYHACAVLDNAKLKCWGQGTFGRLGLGNTTTMGDGDFEMGDNLAAVSLGTGRTAISVSAGGSHTCAVLDNAALKCWGLSNYGQLGKNNKTTLGDSAAEMGDSLTAINLGTGRTALAVSAGAEHTCAILNADALKCWGRGDSAQLGLGSTNTLGDGANEMGDNLAAVNLGDSLTALSVSSGASSTCVVRSDTSAVCFGNNSDGQLGVESTDQLGDAVAEVGNNFTAVMTDFAVDSIDNGATHACAVSDTGMLKCWGANAAGELGQGSVNSLGDEPGEMGAALAPIDLGHYPPTIELSADQSVVTSNEFTLRLTADSSLDCATVSNVDGEDFNFSMLTSLAVADDGAGVCVISAVASYASGDIGNAGLSKSGTFAVSDIYGNVQRSLMSGDSVTVVVDRTEVTTTTAEPTTTTTEPTTTTVESTTTTAAETTTTTEATTTTEESTTTTTEPTTTTAASTTTTSAVSTSTTTTTTTTPASTTTTTTNPPTTTSPPSPELKPSVKLGAKLTASALLRAAGVSIPKKVSIALAIERADALYCRVVKGAVQGVKRGSCRVIVTLKPRVGSATVKRIRLYVI